MNQLPIFGGGEQARDAGLALVELHGEEFTRIMRNAAKLVSEKHGSVDADDLRAWAAASGIKPHHPNAWGAVFKGRGWRCIGRKVSKLKSNHAREVRVWKWEEPTDG